MEITAFVWRKQKKRICATNNLIEKCQWIKVDYETNVGPSKINLTRITVITYEAVNTLNLGYRNYV